MEFAQVGESRFTVEWALPLRSVVEGLYQRRWGQGGALFGTFAVAVDAARFAGQLGAVRNAVPFYG